MRNAPLVFLALIIIVPPAAPAESRRTIDLSGVWEISEGTLRAIPLRFEHRIPVPGLVDMADPPFLDVGVKGETDPRREAFWYRRMFTISDTASTVVMLKVLKAMYGTRVYLNRSIVGEHMPSFTPGYFNLKPYLGKLGEANELIIRVGAARSGIPERYMDGQDYEKLRYLPGIYDNIELICSGTPHIVRLQSAPDIETGTVRVATTLENSGAYPTTVRPSYRVCEYRSGKVVAASACDPIQIGAGEKQTVESRIAIPDPHLWSPEDPFLYRLEAGTGHDSMQVRFGMRSFRFDAHGGLAVLNNKPYYLRGTNITIYRFFEDSLRGDLPWRGTWVRRVFRAFKDMHWNSARFCIGFPPEIWYTIADEEGILLQDEAPIWLNQGMKQRNQINAASLTEEFTEWLQERWNHPAVVLWDAQNESELWDVTSQAIERVRTLDLSNRPWDNGWSPRQAESDPVETHTYFFTHPRFTLPRLASESGDGFLFRWVPGPSIGAAILNEYNWTWLNRDGMPTVLSSEFRVYERVRPEVKHWTPDLYRETNARTVALLTEFFRGHRKLAGVMHFCGLGYSRPNGQTCDDFIDIRSATIEPHFAKYVRDAFAPVGLMIDFWKDHADPLTMHAVPVHVINDLYSDWKGKVTLKVLKGDRALSEQSQPVSVPALGKRVLTYEVTIPEGNGSYQLVAELQSPGQEPVQSIRDFVSGTVQTKVRQSLRGVVTASSFEGDYRPEHAGDDDETTRWSSEFADPQWIMIDLGRPVRISRVELDWGLDYATSYSIEASGNGKDWKEICSNKAGKYGVDEITFPEMEARFVRMYGRTRATPWGYSLYSFDVFPAGRK